MSHRTHRTGFAARIRRSRSVPRQRRALQEDVAGRIRGDLTDELPDEDLTEDLSDALDLYVMGSKPRCEEAEYLELVEEAAERIARGH